MINTHFTLIDMATQFAKVSRLSDGSLWVELRYASPREGDSAIRVERGIAFLGVPFDKWEQCVGEVVDLSTWEGTGEGMIGGPKRCQVAGYLDGPLAFVTPAMEEKEVLERIREILNWLADEDFEFLPEARTQIAADIRRARWCLRVGRELRTSHLPTD
jgi:hypothetical protein